MATTAFRTEIIVKLPKDHEHEKENVLKYISLMELTTVHKIHEELTREFGFMPEIVLNGELVQLHKDESHVTMPKYIQP